jgi:hypothetical protein
MLLTDISYGVDVIIVTIDGEVYSEKQINMEDITEIDF